METQRHISTFNDAVFHVIDVSNDDICRCPVYCSWEEGFFCSLNNAGIISDDEKEAGICYLYE